MTIYPSTLLVRFAPTVNFLMGWPSSSNAKNFFNLALSITYTTITQSPIQGAQTRHKSCPVFIQCNEKQGEKHTKARITAPTPTKKQVSAQCRKQWIEQHQLTLTNNHLRPPCSSLPRPPRPPPFLLLSHPKHTGLQKTSEGAGI